MKSTAQSRVAVDIGGTFTDVVLEHTIKGRFTTKLLTTYDHPGEAVLNGITRVMQEAALKPGDIGLIIHGTTLATNALIERRGAKTALLTTRGHRDALEMAHEDRFEQYDIQIDRPQPLVPRYLRLPVTERMDRNGQVLIPLDEQSVRDCLPLLDEHEVESVAIGYLHAFINPQHEIHTAELLQGERPDLSLTLASEVCPEIREFERLSTACANAYVRPLMARYLHRLAGELKQQGFACPFLLMTSGGGLTTLETASRFPIRLVESGPAGGAILAQQVARQNDLRRLLSFDMGGTTAKLCLIDDFQALHSRSFEVDRVYRFKKGSGLPVRIPVIEMVEIGAGGGSIAQVDKLNRIQVGPESAGSEPGPAAYGRGGELPTVTDADVGLGRIFPETFAGGTFKLDEEAAKQAVHTRLAVPLQLETDLAAFGISEMVDENMAAAARAHAAEFGLDLANRDMVAFGGAAPLHAARLGEKLGVGRIIVPTEAGVGSAVGFLLAPIAYEVVRSRHQFLSSFQPGDINTLMEEMRAEAMAVVRQGSQQEDLQETRQAYMRYVGQGHEIAVSLPVETYQPSHSARIVQAFEEAYTRLYGRTIEGVEIEALSWTLTISEALPEEQLSTPTDKLQEASPDPIAQQSLFDSSTSKRSQVPVFLREQLAPGDHVHGPALITENQTTTVVTAHYDASIDERGCIVLTRKCDALASDESQDREADHPSSDLNPIQLQIIWNRLLAIVEEQAQTLIRTAFSTTVREAGDLSCGVFDARGRMLAQAVTGTPGHVNAMAASVNFFLQKYPLDTLQGGDVLLTNDPWHGTGHLNDFTVVTPVFHHGKAVALCASTSHIADVGGLGFGPDGRQVFEEGLNIPIGFLFRAGEANEVLLEILRANVRDPRAAEGDLHSLTACNHAGSESLRAILEEFALDDLLDVSDLIIRQSRDAMLAEVNKLPQGSWKYSMRVDGYDEAVDLACKVSIAADGVAVDFAGTSAASSHGINVPLTYTQAYASFGVRCMIGNDVPNNAGSLGVVEVRAPEGCILNAPRPAAVSARHAIGQMLPDVVLGCLEKPLQGKVPAEGASCLFGPVFLGGRGMIPGSEGEPFVMNAFYAGGTGARPGKDGLSCTAFPSGVRSTPVEISENTAPLLIWRKEYKPGSGGDGEYRGGLGQVMEFAHAEGEAFAVSKMFDRIHNPPRGRQGGEPGAPARVYIKGHGDDADQTLRGMGREIIPAGKSMVLETAGGGGRGDPGLRSDHARQKDCINGLVDPTNSPEP